MRRAVLVLVLITPSGCDEGDPLNLVTSADLPTSELSLSVLLRGNGNLVQAVATLRNPDGYPVTLTSGDGLILSAPGGPETQLTDYQGSLYAQLETAAEDLDIVLVRGAERVVNPVALPPGFALSGPADPAPRSQPIPISWDAAESDHTMRLDIGGSCISTWFTRPFTGDPGTYAIQPADLAVEAGVEGCDLIVEATRSAAGLALAPTLGPSSSASAEQVRTLTIVTVP